MLRISMIVNFEALWSSVMVMEPKRSIVLRKIDLLTSPFISMAVARQVLNLVTAKYATCSLPSFLMALGSEHGGFQANHLSWTCRVTNYSEVSVGWLIALEELAQSKAAGREKVYCRFFENIHDNERFSVYIACLSIMVSSENMAISKCSSEWRYLRHRLSCFFPRTSCWNRKPPETSDSSNHNINRLASDEGLKKSIGTHLNS